jgi:hypothetical protein
MDPGKRGAREVLVADVRRRVHPKKTSAVDGLVKLPGKYLPPGFEQTFQLSHLFRHAVAHTERLGIPNTIHKWAVCFAGKFFWRFA